MTGDPMTNAVVGMTGVLTTEDDERIETEVAQEMTEVAIAEIEVITVAKMKITHEMIGIVENVATLISHSGQNAIAVGHQRDVAVEAHPNNGLVTIEELAIETNLHNLVQEIGNVASARK
mgnify:CR=1 FL=1